MCVSSISDARSPLSTSYDGFHIDFATSFDIYKSHANSASKRIIGPVYPMDAFSDQDQTVLRSGIEGSMLRAYRITDRLYVTSRDLTDFTKWAGKGVCPPHRWHEDLESVIAALDGIDDLDLSDPIDWSEPFRESGENKQSRLSSCVARDEVSGPIAPVSHFESGDQQVLNWCIRAGLIPFLLLEGVVYVGYSDVYCPMLARYFHSESDHPAAWDGTRAETWSPWRRVTGQFVKPRGFKDAVRSNVLPRISLHRESRHVDEGAGSCSMKAAYPKHVVDQAAGDFRDLYREEGFLGRFRQYEYYDDERDVNDLLRLEPLASFSTYEADLFREFAAEGNVRISKRRGEECVAVSDLMYYDMFAARVVEDQLDIDFEMGSAVDRTVGVMLDGTFAHGWPW